MSAKYFSAVLTAANEDGRRVPVEVVMEARSMADAADILDQLIAHGHSIQGLIGGVCPDNCYDIEGYDAESERADAAMLYPAHAEDDEYPEDDIELRQLREISAEQYEAAKSAYYARA
jgi:hypothetical protein